MNGKGAYYCQTKKIPGIPFVSILFKNKARKAKKDGWMPPAGCVIDRNKSKSSCTLRYHIASPHRNALYHKIAVAQSQHIALTTEKRKIDCSVARVSNIGKYQGEMHQHWSQCCKSLPGRAIHRYGPIRCDMMSRNYNLC